jgi:hypothetical protein
MWVGLYTKALLLVHREIIKKVNIFSYTCRFSESPLYSWEWGLYRPTALFGLFTNKKHLS